MSDKKKLSTVKNKARDEALKRELDLLRENISALGEFVDLVVDASRGDIDVNNVAQVAVGCCATFLKKR